jgi:glutathione reductase (NADPH)
MTMFDYDLFVIGAGSGGVRAARMAAAKGARVAVAEERYLGGTCVNVGCVPKKLFVYASGINSSFGYTDGFGISSKSEFNWPTLRDNKTQEIERLNGIYDHLLTNAGVEIIQGTARILDRHHVQVGDKTFKVLNILIATGGWPFVPDIPGKEHMITSNEAFYLDTFPEHVIVCGGGYIAVEFAGIFAGLGADTHLFYRGNQVLRGFDQEVRDFAAEQITQSGVQIHSHTEIESVEKLDNGKLKACLNNGSTVETDCILMATGRLPKSEGLGLDNLELETNDRGAIRVNEHYQTEIENVFAIGDVIDRVALTPVALAEGMYVADYLFGDKKPVAVDYQNIATAVFCQPNIGTVGLTEEQAMRMYNRVSIFTSTFKPMKHTLSGKQERSLMKLVVCGDSDKVLGAHMVGPDAGEIIQGIAIAIKAGATKKDFDRTIGIHPTAAEEFVTMRQVTRTHDRN